MAFSLFGKRRLRSRNDRRRQGLRGTGISSPHRLQEKRGFFDRMRQAVTRTRDSFAESVGSVLALTREVDETSLAELETVLLAADIGGATARTIIENLRQRGLRQGIEGGEELKRLLKIELKQVLDGVATDGCDSGSGARSGDDGGRERDGQDHHHGQAGGVLSRAGQDGAAVRGGHISRGGDRAA